ncbi:hypothetical protein [Marinicrinis sediminis]|uniref:CYTH domain-containing protein n=1 Tax=Marinicrinis sediminis TaxID=1652465 RepID=A0ABW5R6P4_9BACL
MNQGYNIEYSQLELRFDRRRIQDFIGQLIKEDYSLYWNEDAQQFSIVIRSGKQLVKLKFERAGARYKMIGNYSLEDEKLAGILEKLIGESRGHAVVKRYRNKQVQIDNILFGEVIRSIEVPQQETRVMTQTYAPIITADSVIRAWKNKRAEKRIPVLKLELDYELSKLSEALRAEDWTEANASKSRLEALRLEMLTLEV